MNLNMFRNMTALTCLEKCLCMKHVSAIWRLGCRLLGFGHGGGGGGGDGWRILCLAPVK